MHCRLSIARSPSLPDWADLKQAQLCILHLASACPEPTTLVRIMWIAWRRHSSLLGLQAVCMLLDQLCLGSCALRLLEGLPKPLQNSQQHADEADTFTASRDEPISDGSLALRRGQVAYLQGNAEGIASQGVPRAITHVNGLYFAQCLGSCVCQVCAIIATGGLLDTPRGSVLLEVMQVLPDP